MTEKMTHTEELWPDATRRRKQLLRYVRLDQSTQTDDYCSQKTEFGANLESKTSVQEKNKSSRKSKESMETSKASWEIKVYCRDWKHNMTPMSEVEHFYRETPLTLIREQEIIRFCLVSSIKPGVIRGFWWLKILQILFSLLLPLSRFVYYSFFKLGGRLNSQVSFFLVFPPPCDILTYFNI